MIEVNSYRYKGSLAPLKPRVVYTGVKTPEKEREVISMRTIQFESVVNDNIIAIPVRYRTKIRSGSKVNVTTTLSSGNPANTKTKAGALSVNDFTALQIDTRGFKFDREEANERH